MKPNGQGTYIFHDGRKYVGGWKDGKEHGQATITYLFGEKWVVEWKDGKIWNGTGYCKNGYIHRRWVNGKRILKKNCD